MHFDNMNNKICSISNLALFLIGCCSAIYTKSFGTFAVSEPILFLFVVLSLFKSILVPKSIIRFAILNLLWICGILVSDLYNEIDTEITAKLIGSSILILIDTYAFYIFIKGNKFSPVFYTNRLHPGPTQIL